MSFVFVVLGCALVGFAAYVVWITALLIRWMLRQRASKKIKAIGTNTIELSEIVIRPTVITERVGSALQSPKVTNDDAEPDIKTSRFSATTQATTRSEQGRKDTTVITEIPLETEDNVQTKRTQLADFLRSIPRADPVSASSSADNTSTNLKKLDENNWLIIDRYYKKFHKARAKLLAERKPEVLRSSLGSEAARQEALEIVVAFLTNKYPEVFEVSRQSGDAIIHNKATSERFRIESPYYDMQPLEIAARLAMEDFSILMKGGTDYYLMASATLFPSGWQLSERMGGPITVPVTGAREPVPQWRRDSIGSLEDCFDGLEVTEPMERSTYFIQLKPSPYSLVNTLFIQEPKEFFPGNLSNLHPRNILVRHERHTFRRLPKSDTILFTVKTSLTPLGKLSGEDLEELASKVRAWPEDVATYKGRDLWGPCVLGYCSEKLRTLGAGCDDGESNPGEEWWS